MLHHLIDINRLMGEKLFEALGASVTIVSGGAETILSIPNNEVYPDSTT
jgi:hypothetical protein